MILIDEKDESKTEKKSQSAEEIAEIMVENMKANIANPNFWAEKEERLQKARDEVLKKRKEKHKNEN
ncbi:MAG: hypothetical protein ACFFDY_14025 [Candidatus Thorarchaeota archaeon]